LICGEKLIKIDLWQKVDENVKFMWKFVEKFCSAEKLLEVCSKFAQILFNFW